MLRRLIRLKRSQFSKFEAGAFELHSQLQTAVHLEPKASRLVEGKAVPKRQLSDLTGGLRSLSETEMGFGLNRQIWKSLLLNLRLDGQRATSEWAFHEQQRD